MFNSLSKMRGKLQRSCGSQAKPCILLGSNRALSDFVLLMLLFADLQGAFKILCCLLKLIYAPTRAVCQSVWQYTTGQALVYSDTNRSFGCGLQVESKHLQAFVCVLDHSWLSHTLCERFLASAMPTPYLPPLALTW